MSRRGINMAGKFLRVKCKCGTEQTLFSHVTSSIACTSCNAALAEPSGGEAVIFGKIVKEAG